LRYKGELSPLVAWICLLTASFTTLLGVWAVMALRFRILAKKDN
jgi:hypothetical protein